MKNLFDLSGSVRWVGGGGEMIQEHAMSFMNVFNMQPWRIKFVLLSSKSETMKTN